MDSYEKLHFKSLTALRLLFLVLFAVFWFNPHNLPLNFTGPRHIIDVLLYSVVTYIVWFPIAMKLLAWAITAHIRGTPQSTARPGLKVAMITTFVPSAESKSLLHRTLPAMMRVSYPHDTWLLDEGNDPAVKQLCASYGVHHFSRKDIAKYNQFEGKFARKTKGGNHNSWYDLIGNKYQFVAQMDTDFVPKPEFLEHTLPYFNDPMVAFVGTPQIYGNTDKSLIALGAAQQTFNFYGPLLRGLSGMGFSMLIGANHVIRVAALQKVNYYSAHITEDLLTGMKLHSEDWKSVYLPEVLAVGEGPINWKDYFNQQKRWAYGCMHILFNHSPRLFRTMPWRKKLYYFCMQQHYFGGIAMLMSIICLCLYFIVGIVPTSVNLTQFLLFYTSSIVVSSSAELWLQRFNIDPKSERGLLWAGMYIAIVAWPIYMMAFFALFKRKRLVYKVTPKGNKAKKQAPTIAMFTPHLCLALLTTSCFVSSFYTHRNAPIMLFWALTCGLLLSVAPFLPYIFQLGRHLLSSLRHYSVALSPLPETASLQTADE